VRQWRWRAAYTVYPARREKTEAVGLYGDVLKIRLAAPPVDGKASNALIDFLAKTLSIPKSRLTLVSGLTSRSKRVAVEGVSTEHIERILLLNQFH